MKYNFIVSLVILMFSLPGCWSRARNYKPAYIIIQNDTTYIKLKGRRVPLHGGKTYEDSTLIPIPEIKDGRILGENIYRPSGYFQYKGYIIIDKKRLIVNLKINDTFDHVLRNDTWNGEYILER